MARDLIPLRAALVLAAIIASAGCQQSAVPPAGSASTSEWYDRIITGTWGGDDAGLIATDTSAHVHVGCTFGDAMGPIVTDAGGHFDVAAKYDIDAYPVARDIIHAARLTGTVVGDTMLLTVVLTDTARTLGPVTLIYGRTPQMGPCPICRVPKPRRSP